MKTIIIILILNIFLVKSDDIRWGDNPEGNWAFACDFKNNDLSNVQIRSEDCGAAFWSTEECTHFAWTTYNGGTCWMTSGKVSKSDAFSTGDNTMVCGILEGIYLFILEKMTGGATGLLEINAVNGVEFTLINKCSFSIWPGIFAKGANPLPFNGGLLLNSGQSVTFSLPLKAFAGRIWARTNCKTINNQFKCETGDC